MLQEIARSAAGGVDNSINLDVVAIEQLKKKSTPPTNDLPKYSYNADENGFYSEYLSGVAMDSSKYPKFYHPLNPIDWCIAPIYGIITTSVFIYMPCFSCVYIHISAHVYACGCVMIFVCLGIKCRLFSQQKIPFAITRTLGTMHSSMVCTRSSIFCLL